MKYEIPLGVLILFGIAANLHRNPRPMIPVIDKVRVTEEGPGLALSSSVSRELWDFKIRIPEVTGFSDEESRNRVGSRFSGKRVLVAEAQRLPLEKSLELSALQITEVEGILREREEEIRIWHDDIREGGVLDIRTYEWKVGLLKTSWYRRIDSLLDGVQHQRFIALVEQGFFNEGLAFTVEPGMTVLE